VRESREALAPHPVAPVALTQRAALQHAMIDGRAVHEYEPGGKAAAEMRDLYTWTRGKLTKW
jgi:chromosome partitioning protein